ncbi:hypothetical protein TrRE_jg9136, partial [Triparma retinervis]
MARSKKKTMAMNPARLTRFLDSYSPSLHPSAGGRTSPVLMDRPPSIYDPSISWDGLSVDPRPFSRFDARPTRVDPKLTSAVGLAGNRVVELDCVNDGSVFGISTSGDKVRRIPETHEQLDTVNRARPDLGYDEVVLEEPSFSNFHLNIPTTKPARTPIGLIKGGPNADRCLLTPDERREIMEFEHKRIAAHKLIGKADGARNRLKSLMMTRHTNGVQGVDSVQNLDSRVYGELGRTIKTKVDNKALHQTRRMENLRRINTASERMGYNPFHHNTEVLPASETKVFQSKNRASRVELDTHSRLFIDKGIPINGQRTQKLRDETLAGKDWNITTGTKITTLPSKVPFRNNKMQAHPSQATMQRGRNMQGFLDLS